MLLRSRRCSGRIRAASLAGLFFALTVPALCAPAYAPFGPQTFVNIDTITAGGWTACWVSTYNTTVAIDQALSGCNGDLLMMGGKPAASDVFDVIAWAPRTDVMFDTGFSNTPHNANGVGWYFSPDWSWGFASEGDPINRSSCDIAGSPYVGNDATSATRLCWHTGSGSINGGWRSGANTEVWSTDFERYLFTADSAGSDDAATPEPGTLALVVTGAALAIGSRRRCIRDSHQDR